MPFIGVNRAVVASRAVPNLIVGRAMAVYRAVPQFGRRRPLAGLRANTAILSSVGSMWAELISSGAFEVWQLALPQLRKKLADAEAFLER